MERRAASASVTRTPTVRVRRSSSPNRGLAMVSFPAPQGSRGIAPGLTVLRITTINHEQAKTQGVEKTKRVAIVGKRFPARFWAICPKTAWQFSVKGVQLESLALLIMVV